MLTGKPRNWNTPEPQQLRHIGRLTVCSIALLLIFLLVSGCRTEPEGDFAIYLVKGELSGVDIMGKPADQSSLQEQPLLSSRDIVTYDLSSHEIELTGEAYHRIQAIFPTPVKTAGIPFVVALGKEPIYAGAFWTPLSSLSFDGVIILQPMDPLGRSIRIELGYPSPDAFTGSDPRSNPRIMNSLEREGKIKG